ncbi:MAG: hypothetical protein PHD61_02150 [Bacteroidales bacterium]|nr:hypothetical protein [Lentimicrobiaceae bacterium]MDD5694091.1 hypothetical protein [Bacteroidales bacterium]
MDNISIIGAGNVGATVANVIAHKDLAWEVVMVDIKKGMAGILDTGRYRAFVAEALNVSPKDILSLSLGRHGDHIVPLPRYTSVNGIPIQQLLDKDTIDRIVDRTRKGGGEVVELLGTSAWYAPGAAPAQMVEAIVDDQKRIFPCCAYLQGEYGLKDIYMGVPVMLGKHGVDRVIEIDLNKEEKALLVESAQSVKQVMNVLDDMHLFEEKE